MDKEDIKIRSDEVQEILSKVPSWMVRWGTTLVFSVIALLLVLSMVIKYPDTVDGDIRVTAVHPPITIMAPNGGVITSLSVKEGDLVEKGQAIASLKNPVTENAIALLDTIIQHMQTGLADSVDQIDVFAVNLPDYGELQESVNQLRSLTNEYNLLQSQKGDYNADKIKNLRAQFASYNRMKSVQNRQIQIAQKELKNAQDKMDAYQELFDNGGISKMEFIEEQTNYHAKKDRVEDLKAEQLNNQLAAQKIEVELLDLEFEFENERRLVYEKLTRQLDLLENEIEEWKAVYVIEATASGEITFIEDLTQGEYVASNKPLFAVIPANNQKKGEVIVTSKGLGKVEEGQKVVISLDEFPAHEYGQLNGTVSSITKIGATNGEQQAITYSVMVLLSEDLETSYHEQIDLQGELYGQAKIITNDRSIMARVLSQFKDVFENY